MINVHHVVIECLVCCVQCSMCNMEVQVQVQLQLQVQCLVFSVQCLVFSVQCAVCSSNQSSLIRNLTSQITFRKPVIVILL